MKKSQHLVEQFMHKAGQELPLRPTIPTFEVRCLRAELIGEEWDELCEALGVSTIEGCVMDWKEKDSQANLVAIADAIGDLLVVVLGTASACGIDAELIFNEVMRSNMSKFIDGYKRKDGKWIKGPSYEPPQLAPLLQ